MAQAASPPPSRPEVSQPPLEAAPATGPATSAPRDAPADSAPWPRTYARTTPEGVQQQVVVYAPQVDSWEKFAEISFRCAVAVHRVPDVEAGYGVVEGRATSSGAMAARRVLIQQPELT